MHYFFIQLYYYYTRTYVGNGLKYLNIFLKVNDIENMEVHEYIYIYI